MAINTTSWWPDVSDLQGAEKAIRYGFAAAAIVAGVTGALALASLYLHEPILGIDGLGLVDAVLFAALGFGIDRKSRAAAVGGLVLYFAEYVYKMATGGATSSTVGFMTILLTLYFVHGVRGTFAYRKLSKQAAVAAGAPL